MPEKSVISSTVATRVELDVRLRGEIFVRRRETARGLRRPYRYLLTLKKLPARNAPLMSHSAKYVPVSQNVPERFPHETQT